MKRSTESARRTVAIKLRLPPHAAWELRERAAENGLTLSAFIVQLLLLAIFTAGCARERLTSAPDVVIDSAFSAEATAAIIAGVDSWAPAGIRPWYRIGDARATAVQALPGVVAIVYTEGAHDPRCPGFDLEIGDAADTVAHGAYATICVDARANGNVQTIAAHEFGHAYGLPHTTSSESSVLHPNVDDDAPAPTEFDVANIRPLVGE